MRTVPAEEAFVPELAEQARERAAVHPELAGHLFAGQGKGEVCGILQAEKAGKPAAAVWDGETADTALKLLKEIDCLY